MMPKYQLILLDADGTVLNFTKAQRYAIIHTLRAFDLPVSESIITRYSEINHGYWMLLEQGKITKEELIVQRFKDFLSYLQVPGDPMQMNYLFLQHLGDASYCLDGAEETCRELSRYCTLAIATNGIYYTQKRRLQNSVLAPYISHLIVSERAGAAKPSRQFYDFAMEQCRMPEHSHVLMVGDSLGADILGGVNYGLDTCWCNPQRLPAPPNLPITAVITHISQLVEVVLPNHSIQRSLSESV